MGRSSDCHSFFSTLEVERRPRGASKTQEKNCFGCKTEDFRILGKKISPHWSELKKNPSTDFGRCEPTSHALWKVKKKTA
ncbi:MULTISPECIES: hypothetical protein [Pseudomonas]|uniref:hypothetical protein n=1 Tax=Pseudomonas TaxID=286 RepID=UPI0015737128|nr:MULTISPECIES: hypothetical protein [Pseudomonas]MBG6123567.1 hypothetical protein [Pseudomonas sp. M2]NSX20352.1 hypothetical protein [Pseudomonas putida]HDS1744488.1 hypothetical protein [Pseudomonas putida]